MKQNKLIVTTIAVIILLSLYHFSIHNGLEKIFSQTYFDYYNVKRPLYKCKNVKQQSNLSCIGLPSGHAETASVFLFLLYFHRFTPLWLSILMIVIISLQRVLTNMHTPIQVLFGSLLGLIYASIYTYFNLSSTGFAIVFIFGLLLALLVLKKIDYDVKKPIPSWVDKSMYKDIYKKQNSPFYIKIGSIYVNAFISDKTFIGWDELEGYLEEIVKKIKLSGKTYDAVVGIKTGGAIISDYISNKLGLPNYKIKLSRREYNCNKKPSNLIDDIYKKVFHYEENDYIVCEGINDNLEGKNIILIDELVSTGKVMSESYKYLKKEKHVDIVTPFCLAFYKNRYREKLPINYVFNKTALIWAWGYDN